MTVRLAAKPNWGRKQMDWARGFARNHLIRLASRRCSTLTATHFNKVLADLVEQGYAADTIQGIHDVAKTAIRFGTRNGAHFGGPDIATDIVMPRKRLAERDGEARPTVGKIRPMDVSKQPTELQVTTFISVVADEFDVTSAELLELIDDLGLRWGEAIGLWA